MVQELISYSTITLFSHSFAHRCQTLICFLNCHGSFGNAAAQIPFPRALGTWWHQVSCPSCSNSWAFPIFRVRGTKNGPFPQDTEIGSRGVGEFPALHQPGHPSRSTSSPGGAQSQETPPSVCPSVCPCGPGAAPGGRARAETARQGRSRTGAVGGQQQRGQQVGHRWDTGNPSGSTGQQQRGQAGVTQGPTLAAQDSTNELGGEQRPKHHPALNCPSLFTLPT